MTVITQKVIRRNVKMILYFSGTGNSEYVAKIIVKENNDDLLSINDWMKNNKKETIFLKKH